MKKMTFGFVAFLLVLFNIGTIKVKADSVLSKDASMPLSVRMETGVKEVDGRNVSVFEEKEDLTASFSPDEDISITDETKGSVEVKGMYSGNMGVSLTYNISITSVGDDNTKSKLGKVTVPVPDGFVPVSYSYQGETDTVTGTCTAENGSVTVPLNMYCTTNSETGKKVYWGVVWVDCKRFTKKIRMKLGYNTQMPILGMMEDYTYPEDMEAYFVPDELTEVGFNDLANTAGYFKIRTNTTSGHWCDSLYRGDFKINNNISDGTKIKGTLFVPLPDNRLPDTEREYCVIGAEAKMVDSTGVEITGNILPIDSNVTGMAGFKVEVVCDSGSASFDIKVRYKNYTFKKNTTVTMPLGKWESGLFEPNGQKASLVTKDSIAFSLPHDDNGGIEVRELSETEQNLVNQSVKLLETGYDKVYHYQVQAEIPDMTSGGIDPTRNYDGTLTLPVPDGCQSKGAKVTYMNAYRQGCSVTSPVAVVSSTETTVTVPVSLNPLDYSLGCDVYVEYLLKGKEVPTTGGDSSGNQDPPSSGGQTPSSGENVPGQQTTPATTEAGKTETGAVTEGSTSIDSTGATVTVTSTEGGKVEAEYKPAETTDKKVTVPSTTVVNGVETTITSIADDAFSGNKTVTEVTLPETIEEIGDNAFKGCTKLKKVTIPKNVEEVGKNAFAGCSSLTSVTIKSTTIKKIEQGAFKNCAKLTKITITKSVTTISKDAFSGDKKLKTITIKSSNIKSVGKNAFKGVPKNAVIKVPAKKKKAYAKLFKKAGFKGKVK